MTLQLNFSKKVLLTTLGALLMFGFLNISLAQAKEYQCDISATGAAGCEAYASIKYSCSFPEELNVIRSAEAETGKYTYPKFCSSTCAEQSGIPAKCRAGRISTAQPAAVAPSIVEDKAPTGAEIAAKGTILQNAYAGAKITFSKFWKWLREASAGVNFEIKPMSTPVAGVRG